MQHIRLEFVQTISDNASPKQFGPLVILFKSSQRTTTIEPGHNVRVGSHRSTSALKLNTVNKFKYIIFLNVI